MLGPIITHKDAKAQGLKLYFTGKSCKRGHVCERRVSNCYCVECEREARRKWRVSNAAKWAGYHEKWRTKDPEKYREYYRNYYADNRTRVRELARKAYAANAEKRRELAREAYAANPEKHREYQREWRAENREKTRKAGRRYNVTLNGRASRLLKGARQRAQSKGESFHLTHERILNVIERGVCEQTGLQFNLEPDPKGRRTNRYAPSVDRLDKTRPYSDSNVQIVCWAYNIAKGESTDAETWDFGRRLVNHSVLS